MHVNDNENNIYKVSSVEVGWIQLICYVNIGIWVQMIVNDGEIETSKEKYIINIVGIPNDKKCHARNDLRLLNNLLYYI